MASQLEQWYTQFNPHEKVLVAIIGSILAFSSATLAASLQAQTSQTLPQSGGAYTEGIVGFPRYVNPILANTSPDRDVTSLIFSGLTKRDHNGDIVPDLATDYTASDNQTKYTFHIDPDATFHDGHPVRAEDVVFTIEAIKDPNINGPKRAQWQDVSVTAVNDTTVRFTTDKPFANLPANATVGILPKHIWQKESSRSFAFSPLNTKPIGAGPYKVKNLAKNPNGTPSAYTLVPHDGYPKDTPYINSFRLRFYPDNQSRRTAYDNGEIDGMHGIDPAYAQKLQQNKAPVTTHQFNRVFSVFFNQNNNQALTDTSVRKALADAVPKQEIVNSALSGFGQTVSGPLPPALTATTTINTKPDNASTTPPGQKLHAAGWTINDSVRTKDGETLSVTLKTVAIPSLEKAANLIQSRWDNIGVKVTTQTLAPSELTRQVVRPRNYDALLFGQSVGNLRDLYSFWHSSRQDDPGLNLAQYANTDIDQALKKLRQASSSKQVTKLRNDIVETVTAEQPAAFVFSPSFIYVLPESLKNTNLPPITQADDRFANISDWYTETKTLWNTFVDKQ